MVPCMRMQVLIYFFLLSLFIHSAQRDGGNAKRVINTTISNSTTMRKKRATRCPRF